MTVKQMWERFCNEYKININTPHDVWAFCGGGPFADELAKPALAVKNSDSQFVDRL